MEVSKEYKLGLLFVIGGIVVFLGINFMKTGLNFGASNEYYAIFDNADQLKPENEVQLNGVKIGEVTEVELHPKNPRLILAKFTIENTEIQIPRSSEAWLLSTDFLGTKCIDIRLDLSDTASKELLADGDTLNSRKEMTLEEQFKLQLEPIKNKTEQIIVRVEDIIVEINELWDSSASYTFEEGVYTAREAIDTYKHLARNLTDLINRETKMVTTIKENVATLKDSIMNRMDEIKAISAHVTSIKSDYAASGLVTDIANLTLAMADITANLKKVENGEGTLGSLLDTTKFNPALKSTKRSLDLLMDDMEADPMKYIGLSILGRKIEGLTLTKEEEKMLRDWLER